MEEAKVPVRWFLTDALLQQLKEQFAEGCRLCLLDALDAEDWD
jgi:hypothetical protein